MLQITLTHLSKAYAHPLFSELSLTLSAGGSYALTAPSGFGKTTLLRLIMGLEAPDGGTITYEKNGTAVPLSAVRFSAVFQEDRLCEGVSALQNVCLATGCTKEAAKAALLALLPDADLKAPVHTLSGGQRRRTALVRALLRPDADVFVFDEPFAGLDRDSKLAAVSAILAAKKDRLLLLSTHDREDAILLNANLLKLNEQPLTACYRTNGRSPHVPVNVQKLMRPGKNHLPEAHRRPTSVLHHKAPSDSRTAPPSSLHR